MVLHPLNQFQRGLVFLSIVILISFIIDLPAKLLNFKSSLKMSALKAGDDFPKDVTFSYVFATISCPIVGTGFD